MGRSFSYDNLSHLYERTPEDVLPRSRKLVVFSDLHLGNGGKADDFLPNSDLFFRSLRDHYFARGYTLVLNGDVEELQRFGLGEIMQRWDHLYALFDDFKRDRRFIRLIGNHDMDLIHRVPHGFEIFDALRYQYHGNPIFIFHGHQTSRRFERYNRIVGVGLKYIATPLKIKNYSVADDSLKRFRTEERVYEFASSRKILSVIGHTHRPLFESMSKLDFIKFEIERLCRKYPKASSKKQLKIERSIESYRAELAQIDETDDQFATVASLYNANLVVPCMFNSGTVIGHTGTTCLEIAGGAISLVHWFDQTRSRKYLRYADYPAEQLPDTNYFRVEIKSESLDYIFTRIKLLAGPRS